MKLRGRPAELNRGRRRWKRLCARGSNRRPSRGRSASPLDSMRTVAHAIAAASQLLPGVAAPDGQSDPRWQAIIRVAEFASSNPDEVWQFAALWGSHSDPDIRAAVATCIVEHLLEADFSSTFPRVAALARANSNFALTVRLCWEFGEARLPQNARALADLKNELKHAV